VAKDIAHWLEPAFTPKGVLEAYRHGIFPMGEARGDEIYWFQPDPRAVIPLDAFHVPRSLHKLLRRGTFEITYDQAFAAVVKGCAEGRPVWISRRMERLYGRLHRMGHAHSVEVWQGKRLAGGLYGVQIGAAFMAESKFHRVSNASKVALVRLVERLRERGFALLEVQYLTAHLRQFGTVEISLREYLRQLRKAMKLERRFGE
jgi:leucyl/phenylalanyl-tRNA--protein transferase